MKTLLIGLGIGAVVMGVIATVVIPSTMEVEKETIQIEVTPDWAEDTDAVEAAKSVIQRKAWEIELEEKSGEREVLDDEIENLEKLLGTY